jgi:hypothetical protein
MFSLFKSNPADKLRKKRKKILEEAVGIQRSGDLKAYARKMEEAEELLKKIEALDAK